MYISYVNQNINQVDEDAVVQVLQTEFLTQGAQIPLFEKTVAELVEIKYSFVMNSVYQRQILDQLILLLIFQIKELEDLVSKSQIGELEPLHQHQPDLYFVCHMG